MPIKIAICDDEKNLRENMLALVQKHCEDCHVDLFDSGDALLDANNDYDIYFLDIQMPGIDGMKTAELIRERQISISSKESVIIFITAFTDYMADAFDVKAFHYLVKPLDENKFNVVFSRAINEFYKMKKNADRHILIKCGNSYHKVLSKDVLYAESQGKKVIVTTINEKVEYYEKLHELEKSLGDSFFRCHRCYIVNMEHIVRYNATAIWVTNGDEILLAQKKFQDFVKTFLLFTKNEGVRK